MRPRVVVIGGGISGLAAAHRLRELDPALDVLLLEAGPRLGGVLHTVEQDGFLLEAAADNFLTTPPAAVDLCHRVGLGESLITPEPLHRRVFVVHGGQLLPLPAGFLVAAPSRIGPLLTTPLLSLQGKLRAALECFLPGRGDREDESFEAFVCRRFGREVFDRLAQPLVGSIYSADPRQLSVDATMPRFRELEREHGSLLRAFLRQRRGSDSQPGQSGARYGQFASLEGGMSTLINALAQSLPAETIRCDSPVTEIVPAAGGGWLLALGDEHRALLAADAVIVATPAHHAARLFEPVDQKLAEELREIEYASCAVVSLGYRRAQVAQSLDSFGFVVPLIEKRLILSCSFSSVKYAGRAPADAVLLRVFLGGACQSGLLRLPRPQLIDLAEREVADLLRIDGEPILRHVVRQNHAMPQYHVGHCRRAARIAARLACYPTLALAGNALHGVGIPSCIQSGAAAAERIVSHVQSLTSTRFQPV